MVSVSGISVLKTNLRTARLKIPVGKGGTISRLTTLSTLLSDFQKATINMVVQPLRAVHDSDWLIKFDTVLNAPIFEMFVDANDKLNIKAYNVLGVAVVNYISNSALSNNSVFHIMASFDTTANSAAGARLYINDISDLTVTTHTQTGIPNFLSVTKQAFCSKVDGSSPFDGNAGEIWAKFGVAVDLSVEANRRLFTDNRGRPKPLPADGVVGGITPDVFLKAPNLVSGINIGLGGDFVSAGSWTLSEI